MYIRNFKNKSRATLKFLTKVFFCLAVLILVSVALGAYYLYITTPRAELVDRQISQTTTIYDRTGEHILYQIHGEENRKIISHDQIPEAVRIATIAAEDDNFYNHFGIDVTGILRAIRVNFGNNNMSQGGSTITQQLAKNVFLTPEKSWQRKIKEVMMAFKIEKKYTKDEILDFYLNQVPYGSNAYGIQSAAEIYFAKEAKDLSLDEAAMLTALTKATSYYSPYGKHKEELRERQKSVIKRVGELAEIEQGLINQSLEINTFDKLKPYRESIKAPHFVFYVRDQLEKELGKDVLETGGYKVYTSLDYEIQKKAQSLVQEKALLNETKYGATNAALVALDPKTGEILAMVGSRDYFDERIDGEFNVVTSPRQPGSSFKPIVYAAAFEKGYQPETILFDIPMNFGPDGTGKEYMPKNYNGRFSGTVSMRQALAMSLNVPAVETLYLTGIDNSLRFAKKLGINSLDNRNNRFGLSLVLGGGEVSLLEETSAFSVFANEGIRNPTRAIKKIEKENGELIFNSDDIKSERVVGEHVARKINSVLSDNKARSPVFGARSPLYFEERAVAAKTGTTQENRDGWTVGYTPGVAVGVWAGNNDNREMNAGADGVYVAAPLWSEFMKWILARYPVEEFGTYEKVTSNKLYITGNIRGKSVLINTESGEKVSKKKAKKIDSGKVVNTVVPEGTHCILYYINKDDPLGETKPDFNDPMLGRWDGALARYFNTDDKED
jgi:1A family penicillin-binding protein